MIDRIRYGPDPRQDGDLHVPAGDGPHPVVVAIHGGFWRARWTRELMVPIASDLVTFGIAVWNIEYRCGEGAWRETLDDVSAAIDALAGVDSLDLARVATLGHSAGGHLAGWLATRDDPVVAPSAFVGLAPVLDLVEAERRALGDHAAADFLGGSPDEVPERYELASVAAHLPLGIPQVVAHGARDDTVPLDLSHGYVEAAGDDARLIELPDADHFSVIDPGSREWPYLRQVVQELLA